MILFPKIPTVFKRDPETKFRTLINGEFATPELAALRNVEWRFTEKIDGTNIRVGWDGETLSVGGRTERAQIPPFLDAHLQSLRPGLASHFGTAEGGGDLFMLCGEGYGAKIQKGGGDYIPDGCGFILFDVWAENPGCWLGRESVADIAAGVGIPFVPEIGRGTLSEMVELSRSGFSSLVAATHRLAEGIVARPVVELLDRRGHRILTKIKHRDFVR